VGEEAVAVVARTPVVGGFAWVSGQKCGNVSTCRAPIELAVAPLSVGAARRGGGGAADG